MADEEEARPDPSANVVPAADDNEEVLSLLRPGSGRSLGKSP